MHHRFMHTFLMGHTAKKISWKLLLMLAFYIRQLCHMCFALAKNYAFISTSTIGKKTFSPVEMEEWLNFDIDKHNEHNDVNHVETLVRSGEGISLTDP